MSYVKHISTTTYEPVAPVDTTETVKVWRSLRGFEQDTLTKALPWIVGGIIAIVAYNFTRKKGAKS